MGPVRRDEFGQQTGVTGTGRSRSRSVQGQSSAGGATGMQQCGRRRGGTERGAEEEDRNHHIKIKGGSAGRVGRPGLRKLEL